jgi:hypothetical protein
MPEGLAGEDGDLFAEQQRRPVRALDVSIDPDPVRLPLLVD